MIQDGERLYSEEDIFELLTKAEKLGLNLDDHTLAHLTIAQLDRLVNVKQ